MLPRMLSISCPSHLAKGPGGSGLPLSCPQEWRGRTCVEEWVFCCCQGMPTFGWQSWGGLERTQVGLGIALSSSTRISQLHVIRP